MDFYARFYDTLGVGIYTLRVEGVVSLGVNLIFLKYSMVFEPTLIFK